MYQQNTGFIENWLGMAISSHEYRQAGWAQLSERQEPDIVGEDHDLPLSVSCMREMQRFDGEELNDDELDTTMMV